MSRTPNLAHAVLRGLSAEDKSLPTFLLYDARGSALFEQITTLPEYYLTRAERAIFEGQARAIVAHARSITARRLDVLELGSGNSLKSQILLRALSERQGRTLYMPADLSRDPLCDAVARLRTEEPDLELHPLLADHYQALRSAHELTDTPFVWFLGSSIGNYDHEEATSLLRAVKETLGKHGLFLLGADLRKDVEVLVRAYDDAQGVTAAFNKNILVRINRELGGHFDPDSFRHVALWNEDASRMEMHLESRHAQEVAIDGLGLRVALQEGERIHTESSHKYDQPRLEAMLGGAGLALTQSFADGGDNFAVHLVRPE